MNKLLIVLSFFIISDAFGQDQNDQVVMNTAKVKRLKSKIDSVLNPKSKGCNCSDEIEELKRKLVLAESQLDSLSKAEIPEEIKSKRVLETDSYYIVVEAQRREKSALKALTSNQSKLGDEFQVLTLKESGWYLIAFKDNLEVGSLQDKLREVRKGIPRAWYVRGDEVSIYSD